MDEFTKAIIEETVPEIRSLARSRPESISTRTESGSLPLDLASKSGKTFSKIALIRLEAPSDHDMNYVETLGQAIRSISQKFTCAGWFDEIEYILWYRIEKGTLPKSIDAFHFSMLDPETLDDLKHLAFKTEGWLNEGEFVSAKEWSDLFDSWCSTRVAER